MELRKKLESFREAAECFALLGKGAHVGMSGVTAGEEELSRAYQGAAFYVLYNPPFGNVMNVTYELPEEGLIWESFANVDGDERHTIHFTYEKWPNPRLWRQDEPSPDKPGEVIGKQWYAYRLPDVNPWRLKNQ